MTVLPPWLLQSIAGHNAGTSEESPVARLLSATPDRPAFIGWRCGGSQYPEFQLDGLAACVAAGYDGVDVCVRPTSDGVYVCSHDWNTTRLTGQNVEFWKTPWSEVEKLTYTDGKTHYQRLETLVEALPQSVALIIDYKNLSSNPNYDPDNDDAKGEAKLWDYLKSVYNNPAEHVVNKSFIESKIHERAKAAIGIKSMMMLYDDKVNNVPANVDILGLNWNADKKYWDKLKSYGKPTIAHIIGSAESYNDAKVNRPSMYMCGMPNTYGPMSR